MQTMREQFQGECEHCRSTFPYYLVHCGFSDTSYAYCDSCGMTALLSYWVPAQNKRLPKLPECVPHQEICADWEPHLRPCACGGSFRKGASPRCPKCKERLSSELAANYIERNAPGTKKGWTWERSWHGLYCIVVANSLVEDNFKELV